MNRHASWLNALQLGLLAVTPVMIAAQETATAPKQFLYLLHVAPSKQVESAWTARDHAAVDEHFKRLQDATAAGKVVLAGRTNEPLDKTFGIVIFEAESEDAARKFMEDDPAVKAGVMTATLHPYGVALERKH